MFFDFFLTNISRFFFAFTVDNFLRGVLFTRQAENLADRLCQLFVINLAVFQGNNTVLRAPPRFDNSAGFS